MVCIAGGWPEMRATFAKRWEALSLNWTRRALDQMSDRGVDERGPREALAADARAVVRLELA